MCHLEKEALQNFLKTFPKMVLLQIKIFRAYEKNFLQARVILTGKKHHEN